MDDYLCDEERSFDPTNWARIKSKTKVLKGTKRIAQRTSVLQKPIQFHRLLTTPGRRIAYAAYFVKLDDLVSRGIVSGFLCADMDGPTSASHEGEIDNGEHSHARDRECELAMLGGLSWRRGLLVRMLMWRAMGLICLVLIRNIKTRETWFRLLVLHTFILLYV